ncbi:hypothetical protein M885DRAFT_525794 [Pelagophyceae sp. CCMP2097]|nr:hypothetical protein M885DRAFT_525794 [Pelagophyceae sp. CCMP2097]
MTADGHKLGSWVGTQRAKRKDGGLSAERTAQLEALGIVWDPLDTAWDEGYARLETYKEEHCLVLKWFVTADGHKLWV